jgi:hypothetical protein
MVYRGTVKNGVIIFDEPPPIPEGADVSVRLLKGKPKKAKPSSNYEHYKSCIGTAKGLPADASINIDHYLYGAPKRKQNRAAPNKRKSS